MDDSSGNQPTQAVDNPPCAPTDAASWASWKGNGSGQRVVTERQLSIFERAR